MVCGLGSAHIVRGDDLAFCQRNLEACDYLRRTASATETSAAAAGAGEYDIECESGVIGDETDNPDCPQQSELDALSDVDDYLDDVLAGACPGGDDDCSVDDLSASELGQALGSAARAVGIGEGYDDGTITTAQVWAGTQYVLGRRPAPGCTSTDFGALAAMSSYLSRSGEVDVGYADRVMLAALTGSLRGIQTLRDQDGWLEISGLLCPGEPSSLDICYDIGSFFTSAVYDNTTADQREWCLYDHSDRSSTGSVSWAFSLSGDIIYGLSLVGVFFGTFRRVFS